MPTGVRDCCCCSAVLVWSLLYYFSQILILTFVVNQDQIERPVTKKKSIDYLIRQQSVMVEP